MFFLLLSTCTTVSTHILSSNNNYVHTLEVVMKQLSVVGCAATARTASL